MSLCFDFDFHQNSSITNTETTLDERTVLLPAKPSPAVMFCFDPKPCLDWCKQLCQQCTIAKCQCCEMPADMPKAPESPLPMASLGCYRLSPVIPVEIVLLSKFRQDFGITLTPLDEINPAQPNPIIFLATSATERLSEDLSTEMTKIRGLVGDSSSRKDLLIMCTTGLPQIRPDEKSLAIAFFIDNRFSEHEREIIEKLFVQSHIYH